MQKITLIASLTVLALAGQTYAAPKAPKANAAPTKCAVMTKTVNGISIPASRMEYLIQQSAERGQEVTPEICNNMMENLVITELLAQQANKNGLTKSSGVKAELEMSRNSVLARSLVQAYVKNNPITDAQIEAKYKEEAQKMTPQKQYRASHILVKTEEEAQAALAEINGGKPFEEVAKARSIDGSKDNGGDLDWSTADRYVPEFSQAMVALKKGEISKAPVKSQFGYHLIRLVDVKEGELPPLDGVKEQIKNQLQNELVEKFIADAKKSAKIK